MSEVIDAPIAAKKFTLTARQQAANALLQTQSKHILLEGGSRSGKTFLLVRAVVIRALKAPRSRHVILRFHFKDCKEAIGMDTLPSVMSKCFPGVPYSLNKQDWIFTLPNKAEIWLGGLDDKDRTEKVLGKEYCTIYLNEISQISYSARNLARTRLAQNVTYMHNDEPRQLALKMYYDCNPPSKSHWAYRIFHEHIDPDTKMHMPDAENHAAMRINPTDNRVNLSQDYLDELNALPARMRRRFLEGEYAEVAPGALWTEELIDTWRVSDVPDMTRVVVAVDPSGAGDEDNEGNDAIGIVVCGLGIDGNGYVLEDLTIKAGPQTWGSVAVSAYERHMADLIVAEKNFGGEMVRFVVQSAEKELQKRAPFKFVQASRGKVVRAEPISSLQEKGKVRFAGRFNHLEDELCAFTHNGYKGEKSPNRADAFVWGMTELFSGMVKKEPVKSRPAPNFHRHAANGYLGA